MLLAVPSVSKLPSIPPAGFGQRSAVIPDRWNNFLQWCRNAQVIFDTLENRDHTHQESIVRLTPLDLFNALSLHALIKVSEFPSNLDARLSAHVGSSNGIKGASIRHRFTPLCTYLNPMWDRSVFIDEVARARKTLVAERSFTPLANYSFDYWRGKLTEYLAHSDSSVGAQQVAKSTPLRKLPHSSPRAVRDTATPRFVLRGRRSSSTLEKPNTTSPKKNVVDSESSRTTPPTSPRSSDSRVTPAGIQAIPAHGLLTVEDRALVTPTVAATTPSVVVPEQIRRRVAKLLGIVEVLGRTPQGTSAVLDCTREELAMAMFLRALQSSTIARGVLSRVKAELAISTGTVDRRLSQLTQELEKQTSLSRLSVLFAAIEGLPVEGKLSQLIGAAGIAKTLQASIRLGRGSRLDVATVESTSAVPPFQEGVYDGVKIFKQQALQAPLLTQDQEAALAARIKAGDESAREQMILANLRLVVKIAQEYDFKNGSLTLLDLINEGTIGLMTAVVRFDPAKGAKLSTYASWWIKQSIHRALANQNRDIRIPIHRLDDIRKVGRVLGSLEQEGDDVPSSEFIAGLLGSGWSAKKVEDALALAQIHTKSLDERPPNEPDSNSTFGDTIADTADMHAGDVAVHNDQIAFLRQILTDQENGLTGRERKIIDLRFGLTTGEIVTLEQIGAKFGVTRERIRQLEAGALRKLHNRMQKKTTSLSE
jgi:RNA polymerase primary sigma factor